MVYDVMGQEMLCYRVETDKQDGSNTPPVLVSDADCPTTACLLTCLAAVRRVTWLPKLKLFKMGGYKTIYLNSYVT